MRKMLKRFEGEIFAKKEQDETIKLLNMEEMGNDQKKECGIKQLKPDRESSELSEGKKIMSMYKVGLSFIYLLPSIPEMRRLRPHFRLSVPQFAPVNRLTILQVARILILPTISSCLGSTLLTLSCSCLLLLFLLLTL